VIHPLLGDLAEASGGGWGLTLSLTAFQPFYERWYDDGDERQDTCDAEEKAGRFRIILLLCPSTGPTAMELRRLRTPRLRRWNIYG
jgi:hypothetical protein